MSRSRVLTGLFSLFIGLVHGTATASDGVQWVSHYNTNNLASESGAAVAVDSTGCVYVAGSVGVGASSDYLTIKLSQSGEIVWATNYNGPGNAGDAAVGVAVDTSGNVFVVGYSTFTAGRIDLTTVSYDNNGNQRWVGRARGLSVFTPGDPAFVSVDKDGSVIVSGHSTALRPADDFLTVKYNNNGVPVWTNTYNGDGSGVDIPQALAVDSTGNVYVAGTSPGDGVADDYAVVKYAPAGNRLWVVRYNGPINGNDRLRALALDSANNVYVTGISPGLGTGGDFLTLKINPAGTVVRSMRFAQQGAGTDDAKALAIDASDNVYVTGTSSNAFTTLKYDPNGNLLWVRGYRPPGTNEFPVAMKIDPSGNVLIAGVRSSLSTGTDYSLIVYHPSGIFLAEALYNGDANGNDNLLAMALDSSGSVFLTGQSDSPGGGTDIATARFSPQAMLYINHAPSFVKGPDQLIVEDAGLQSIPNWAGNISAGSSQESTQHLNFVLTVDRSELFALVPAIDPTGTLTYQSAPDLSGSALITVVLHDDGGTANGGQDSSAPQTFSITILPVNDAPSFVAGPDQTVLEDAGAQTVTGWAAGISAGPADEAGQHLNFVVSNDHPELFAHQPAVGLDGTLTYTPAPNANGLAVVTVALHDDGGTDNGGSDTSVAQAFGILVLDVNDPPSFVAGGDQMVLEDAGAQTVRGWATAIAAGPADEFGQRLNFILSNDHPELFAAQPSVTFDGTLSYRPAANANGSATVTVALHDDGGTANGGIDISAAQTFHITLLAVNDPPTFAAGPDQTVLEDAGPQSVAGWATAISAGPADEAGQHLNFVVSNDHPELFAGQPAVGSDGTLTYTPAANANGSAKVTVTLQDDGGIANGGSNTSVAQTFRILVLPVNDAPSFVVGADQTVLEDAGPQTVTGWATAISAGPADEAGQHLTFVVSNDHSELFASQPSVTVDGTLSYTPAVNANGSAVVTLTLHDDGGTANGGNDTSAAQAFLIVIMAVNDAPSFVVGPDQTVLEDAGAQAVPGWATAISAGPADEAGQHLNFVVSNDRPELFASQPSIAVDGTLSYTPAANANGSAVVTLALHDDGGTANGGSDTSAPQAFLIVIVSVNDAPSFVAGADQTVLEDAGAQSVTGWATAISAGPADEAGQHLNFVVSNDHPELFAAQPAVGLDGTLSYTPVANGNGAVTVTVALHDDGGKASGGSDTSAAQTFHIVVVAVNDGPSFVAGADQTVLEDAGAQSVAGWATAISAGPADEAGQHLNFIVSNDHPELFAAQPSVAVDGTLTYTPAANVNGSATVTVALHDDGGTANGGSDTSAARSFRIAVVAVNDPPSFTLGSDQTVLEDAGPQTVLNWARNISAGPTDEAAQVVNFLVVSNSNPFLFSAQPAVSAAGTLTYTPAANANGTALVTLVLQDNGGTANGGVDTSTPQSFRINVIAVNDPPYANSQSVTVNQDGSVAIILSAGDVDGDALSYTLTSPAHGTLTGTPPNLIYTPKPHYPGSDSFTFKVSNGQLESAVATVNIEILHVNHPPIAIARIYSPTLVGTNETNAVVIAADNHTGLVIFDSSLSSDPDNDRLQCFWYEAGTNVPFASGVRVTNSVSIGSYNVMLVVADASLSSTDSVQLQVASGGELSADLIQAIQTSGLPANTQNALISSLQSAISSFDKMNFNAAVNQLNAFENKVRAQLARSNPQIAALLLDQAEDIITAIDGAASQSKK